MSNSVVLNSEALVFPWRGIDPFLVCVYHCDLYPRGNVQLGPDATLHGRNLGRDFADTDGWRMYYGLTVPGFPKHPHRGFETVTVTLKGMIDHSDSLGNSARYGSGDVQWLTAGSGLLHAEMFPLLEQQQENPLECFQLWLNLPASRKMAQPRFSMLWAEDLPRHVFIDSFGGRTEVTCIAGGFSEDSVAAMPPTPPDSWASSPESDLAIWMVNLAPGAPLTLPPAFGKLTRRSLLFYKGSTVQINGVVTGCSNAIELDANQPAEIINGPTTSNLLMLQGRPISEPVVQVGAFSMNTEQEIAQAMDDFRRTQFGGWPWPTDAPVHGMQKARFAKYVDGTLEVRQFGE
jgi:quercetin 2,3-dioxygenase